MAICKTCGRETGAGWKQTCGKCFAIKKHAEEKFFGTFPSIVPVELDNKMKVFNTIPAGYTRDKTYRYTPEFSKWFTITIWNAPARSGLPAVYEVNIETDIVDDQRYCTVDRAVFPEKRVRLPGICPCGWGYSAH